MEKDFNTHDLIKKLENCKLMLKPEDIEYELIEKTIRSLKRKIDMGKNPYKFKSSGSFLFDDGLNDFFRDDQFDDFKFLNY